MKRIEKLAEKYSDRYTKDFLDSPSLHEAELLEVGFRAGYRAAIEDAAKLSESTPWAEVDYTGRPFDSQLPHHLGRAIRLLADQEEG